MHRRSQQPLQEEHFITVEATVPNAFPKRLLSLYFAGMSRGVTPARRITLLQGRLVAFEATRINSLDFAFAMGAKEGIEVRS